MQNVYKSAMDPYIAVRKVFTKASDTFAYADEACTTKISCEALYDAFLKGLVIVDGKGNEYVPTSCNKTDKVTTLTYVTADSTAATTAKLATLKSE